MAKHYNTYNLIRAQIEETIFKLDPIDPRQYYHISFEE